MATDPDDLLLPKERSDNDPLSIIPMHRFTKKTFLFIHCIEH